MTKTMLLAATVVGLLVAGASAAAAQTLNPTPEGGPFISLSVGGQPQTRTFSSGGTFTAFGETGRFQVNQNIGRGFMIDVSGGYQIGRHLGFGAGVWTARSKSAIAASATIPDPLFFGRFNTVTLGDDDKNPSTLGVNFMVMWIQSISDKFDAIISVGPTITRTSLDVGSVAINPSSSTPATLSARCASPTILHLSATGAGLLDQQLPW